jgi:transposase
MAIVARAAGPINPLSGHLFVFRSRLGDRVKLLVWDRSGFCLWSAYGPPGSYDPLA